MKIINKNTGQKYFSCQTYRRPAQIQTIKNLIVKDHDVKELDLEVIR